MYNKVLLTVIALLFGFYLVSSSDLDDHPSWDFLPIDNCGHGAISDKIVGGREASLGQFPWIARIGYRLRPRKEKVFYLCAGSLINPWYILTAVHCFVGILGDTITSVRLGENFLKENEDCEFDLCAPPVQDIKIGKVIKYEHYVGTLAISYGDIGLLKMAEAVQYNDFVHPICLPRGRILDNIGDYIQTDISTVEVAGWGITNSVSKHIPNKLMFVRMPVVDLDICKSNFRPNKIDDSQICVGIGDGRDSCVGDSGGPLMNPVALNSPPKYYIFGIVSYGMKWCGISAAVYTNVTFYLQWILDNVDE